MFYMLCKCKDRGIEQARLYYYPTNAFGKPFNVEPYTMKHLRSVVWQSHSRHKLEESDLATGNLLSD